MSNSSEVIMYNYNKTRKIAAIKFVRAVGQLLEQGTGLSEAKKMVDIMEATGRPISFGMVARDLYPIIKLAADASESDLTAPSTRPIHISDFPGRYRTTASTDTDTDDIPF